MAFKLTDHFEILQLFDSLGRVKGIDWVSNQFLEKEL
jgi:hypothetical protein